MLQAIYGCYKGHSTKRDALERESVVNEVDCECGERAKLFSVLDKPLTSEMLRVVNEAAHRTAKQGG